jgi:signal transduction histidine kinase
MDERAPLPSGKSTAAGLAGTSLAQWAHASFDTWRDWSHNWPPDYDTPAIRHKIERVIANARVALAGVVMLGVWLDPDEPARWAAFVYVLSGVFLIYSLILLLKVRRSLPSRAAVNLIHAVDLLFPMVLILFTAGPRSPYFLLLIFSFLFGAMRWGMAGALVTGGIGIIGWLLIGLVALSGAAGFFGWGASDASAYLLRVSYVVIAPLLIGYLMEGRRRVSAEQAVLGNFLRLAQVRAQGREAVVERLQAIFTEGLHLFPARRLLLAVQDSPGGRTWLWEFDPPEHGHRDGLASVKFSQLRAATWPVYLGPRPGPTWQEPLDPADPLARLHDCKRLAGCDVALGGEIYGRMLLLDPTDYPLPPSRLRLLRSIGTQLAPLLLSEYLLAQLRRLGAEHERRRLALELHDGVLQSLSGLELEVEAARRSARDPEDDAQRLAFIRRQLNDATLDLRRLMGELQDPHPEPVGMPVAIRRLAARLQRETGIKVELQGIDDLCTASRRIARELPAMVQEALVNIRKHANAQRVELYYREVDGEARLAIRDDGKGYPPEAALTGAELDASEHAPAVLLARARQLGVRLSVVSAPGGGTTVEIAWPVPREAVASATEISSTV